MPAPAALPGLLRHGRVDSETHPYKLSHTRGHQTTDRPSCGRIAAKGPATPDAFLMRRYTVILLVCSSFLGGLLPSIACALDVCGNCCPAQPADPAHHAGSGIPDCFTDAACAVSSAPAISASLHLRHVQAEFPSLPPGPPVLATWPRSADTGGLLRLVPRPVARQAGTAALTYLRTARLRL